MTKRKTRNQKPRRRRRTTKTRSRPPIYRKTVRKAVPLYNAKPRTQTQRYRLTPNSALNPPTNLTLNENTVIYKFGANADKWVNAPVGRRPPDGEADTTQYAQPNAGSIVRSEYPASNSTIDTIYNAPAAIKRLLLTGLFGVTLGTVIDYMLGGPLGLTSKLIRFLIRLLPGGSILLSLFDTASSLFSHFGGDERAAKTVLQNPQIVQLTQIAKPYTTHEAAEKLVTLAAEKQIGKGNRNALLLGVANVLYLMLSKKLSGNGMKTKKPMYKLKRNLNKNVF